MPLGSLKSGMPWFGIAVLAVAGAVGGWEWAIICLIVLALLPILEAGILPVFATAGVGLFWLALFCWMGDRRLFFPYSMQYAVQLMCLLRGRVQWPSLTGAGVVVGVFTLIRIAQSASVQVLAVELVIAALVLWCALTVYDTGTRGPVMRVIAAALGSVLAFAGLVF